MSAPAHKANQAQQMMGQLEYLLNEQFLRHAYLGGLLSDAPAAAVTQLAIEQAKSDSLRMPSADNQICHEVLIDLLAKGHSLPRAIALGRRTPEGSAAFDRLQNREMETLLKQGRPQ